MGWKMTNLHFQIAPIIHEWTYDAMCHDLLNLEGNKYVYEASLTFRILFVLLSLVSPLALC